MGPPVRRSARHYSDRIKIAKIATFWRITPAGVARRGRVPATPQVATAARSLAALLVHLARPEQQLALLGREALLPVLRDLLQNPVDPGFQVLVGRLSRRRRVRD